MMISGISSNSLFSYSSVSSANSTSTNTTGNMQGGRPAGPPPGGGKGQGPKVDTNSDEVWDSSELEALASQLSEANGTSFSASDVMSTYDANGDLVIDADESVALKENDAFNLKDMQNMMMGKSGGNRPAGPPPPADGAGQVDESDTTSDLLDQLLDSLIDSDEDDQWDSSEIEAFSEMLESASGSGIDTEAVLEKYDVDNDGYISGTERAAMKEDDAFGLGKTNETENASTSLNSDQEKEQSFIEALRYSRANEAYQKQAIYSQYMDAPSQMMKAV